MKASAARSASGISRRHTGKGAKNAVRNSTNSLREARSLADLAWLMGRDGERPLIDGLAGELASMPLLQRQSAVQFLQRIRGNSFVQRLAVQAKFQVGPTGDKYEQEADQVATQVMRMSDPNLQLREDPEEEPIQTQPVTPKISPLIHDNVTSDEDAEPVRLKDTREAAPQVSPELESQIHARIGDGQPLPKPMRNYFEPRFGYDFSQVLIHKDAKSAETAEALNARAYTVGRDIFFGSGHHALETAEGKNLLAHELTHVVQQSAAHGKSPPRTIMRGKGKAAKKIVGWIVKVGERKLIKRTAIYTEREMVKLLGKGYNILVRNGRKAAEKIAKKVWSEKISHHIGHFIRKTGKIGHSHFQPLRKILGRPGEKGWHIFYSIAPMLLFSEDVEAIAIYEDKYPGKSIANYLTVTHYTGEDSWLSYLDWINPLELIAIGGDIGRSISRELNKELKAIVFNRVESDGSIQTYELDPNGILIRVIIVNASGKKKEMSAEAYYAFLEKHGYPNVSSPKKKKR